MDVATRFWGKVDKSGPLMPGMETPCWVWAAALTMNGYGWFWLNGRPELAHRVAWFLKHGSFPTAPMEVLHACDHRPCVLHLFEGTNTDNAADKVQKGRQRGAPGAANGSAKLNDALVREIRAAHAAGETNVALGRRHGVHHSMIARIVNGLAWREA